MTKTEIPAAILLLIVLIICAYSIYSFRMKEERKGNAWTTKHNEPAFTTDSPNVFYNVSGEGTASFTFGDKGFFIRPDAEGMIFHADTVHLVMGDSVISYSIIKPAQ